MKRKNNKLLTLMLAGVLCAATAGTVAAALPVKASADTTAKSVALSEVFKADENSPDIKGEKYGEINKTALTFDNEEAVRFNRNLAIKWFEGKGTAKYMTLKFTFKDVDFTEMEFTFNATALHAAKDDIAVNTIKFIKKENKVFAQVINGQGNGEEKETAIVAGSSITLTLSEGGALGCYAVNLAIGSETQVIGEFTNIGAKYFKKDSSEMKSLVMKAKTETKTVLFVDEINGQSFDKVSDTNSVEDTAAPVLVVNEDVNTLLLGAKFELDCTAIDVLKDSLTSKQFTKSFYQYNPADEKVSYYKISDDKYDALKYANEITTSTYFMDTVMYKNGTEFSKEAKDGFTQTSVYREYGEEYVAIRFILEDDTYTGTAEDTHPKAYYDLAWYAEAGAVKSQTVGTEAMDYIIVNRETDGPDYKAYTKQDVLDYEAQLKALIEKEGEEVKIGGTLKLPLLNWLIEDENDGYQTLKFTVSLKKPSSSSPTTPVDKKAPSELKIEDSYLSEAGLYEFKVFASDAAGNAMMVEDEDGKLVEVTGSNVWDLDNVPSFKFTIGEATIELEGNQTPSLDTLILDETYDDMPSFDLVGTTSEDSTYALYQLDLSKYKGAGSLTVEKLYKVSYKSLQTEAQKLVNAELATKGYSEIDFQAINKQAYINLIASALGGDLETEKAEVAKIFVTAIEENSNNILEGEEGWVDSYKFNWKASSQSFKAVESGYYIIMVDLWDTEIPVGHASAYQVIEVASEADVIKGETEWLKNNLVSVILFSVAAVMLILIIILLLVKPSDETLEDVDEKVVSKRKEATDKHKNNK